ncbi:hypothetical protein RG393_003798 [Morganella morganii]|nr:hypothetical protein [Morganella morganii]
MEFKGTPGPWEITDYVESNRYTASETYHHIGAGKWFHDNYSNTGFGLSGFMSIHDARLITAAPDLLYSLQKLLTEYKFTRSQLNSDTEEDLVDVLCVRNAMTAINKALGRE